MSFSEKLESYLGKLDITARELAEASGLSPSSISRYLSGERTPSANGEAITHLADGIAKLGGDAYNADDISRDLRQGLSGSAGDATMIADNLSTLMSALDINGNRMAHALGFDPSYISRIRSGKRRPANASLFAEQVARFVARDCGDPDQVEAIAKLCGASVKDAENIETRERIVREYLGSSAQAEDPSSSAEEPLERFLAALDAFDLDRFLEETHFSQIKVPTVPLQLPSRKTYTGIEQMKQAELDFLKTAVLSKSNEDVILYSDMPLEEMAKDKQFTQQVMSGVALLVRKGLSIKNIHDVHRPVEELFMGLEGWLPVYLVGAMESYYLSAPTNAVFMHFLRSAGTVACAGEAIVGDQGSGRYVVTKSYGDVAYYRTRAKQLLAHAKPLLRVFREGQEDELERALHKIHAAYGDDIVSVGAGSFSTLSISALPGRYVLITKSASPHVDILVEQPALVDALMQFRPTLF